MSVAAGISYVPQDPPVEVGAYNGQPICWVGTVRYQADDGWTVLTPHQATPGTVGADPPPLDDPDYVALVVERAEGLRP